MLKVSRKPSLFFLFPLTPLKTAKIYYLQTLTSQQIEEFLISRTSLLPQHSKFKGADYEKACKSYLAQTLNPQQSSEELAASLRILSNPMDLTLVSLMMAQGNHPNLFNAHQLTMPQPFS